MYTPGVAAASDRRSLSFRGAAVREQLDGENHSAGHSEIALERLQGSGCLPVSAQRVGARLAGVHRQRWDGQAEHDRRAEQRGDPPLADDEPAPPLPPVAEGGRANVEAVAVERRPPGGEQDRQQRHRTCDRHERDDHAASTDAAQERDRYDQERDQAEGHGRGTQDDRAPGGRRSSDDRLLVSASCVALLPPPGDEKQRIVDCHAEAQEGDQILDEEVDRRHLFEAEHEQEAAEDGGQRDQQWHDRDRRAVHEQQDGKRAGRSDQGLDEHAGRSPASAASALDLLKTRHLHL